MPRPTLRSSNWPFPLNILARILEFLGSAALATVVIALSAVVLGWATWLESKWGTPAVQFGVYQSIWFTVLIGLLGVNVLAAVVVRFPWRRKQTGFLLVHAGILMLLVGCWMTRQDGIDGRMTLLEGDRSSTVMETARYFELAIVPGHTTGHMAGGGTTPKHTQIELIEIPFRPGPFNWNDYERLGWFPWALLKRDQGTIYDRDGVKLEVLDYYSDSRRIYVPELKLRVAHGRAVSKQNPGVWRPVTLAVKPFGSHHMSPHRSMAVGARRELGHGETVLFRLATNEAETAAFLDSRPEGPLGRSGQIVLHADGKKYHFLVDKLLANELEGKPPVPLGQSGLAVELVEFDRKNLRVALSIHRANNSGTGNNEAENPAAEKSETARTKRVGALVLYGFQTNLDQQDRKNGVYGSFWFDPNGSDTEKDNAKKDDVAKGDKKTKNIVSRQMLIAAGRPRLDIIQGHDRKLYYRTWRAPTVGTIGELPADGSETVVFETGAFNKSSDNKKASGRKSDDLIPATVYVERFTPSDRPAVEIRPMPFKKDVVTLPRVKVRLSVDGNRQEFWLAEKTAAKSTDERRRFVQGGAKNTDDARKNTRGAAVRLVGDTVELGFSVVLDDFQQRLDPGTSRPSSFSSQVDFITKPGGKIIEEDVMVILNRPVSVTDPDNDRTYRFFQFGFLGPYRPGDWKFDQAAADGSLKGDELYSSTFSVASDPGRQLKYAGCLMIVAGIVVMYYMKAYFFRKKRNPPSQPLAASQSP